MEIYSTMSREKEELNTLFEDKIKLFVCGPTVYDDAHIGHGRTYISFDTIKRYLEFKGYSVFYLQNITDIDDKIINRAKENGEDPYIIGKIIETEKIEATEADVDAQIAKQAESVEKSFEEYKQGMPERQIEYIKNQLIIDKFFDFLIKNIGNRKILEMDFFGGEPLMNLDVVKKTVEYAKEEGKEIYKEDNVHRFLVDGICKAVHQYVR